MKQIHRVCRAVASIALCAVTFGAGWISGACAATNFTWSGAGGAGSSGYCDWSNSANWAGGSAPSGSVGALDFPATGAVSCGSSYGFYNDVSGISAASLDLEQDIAGIAGDGITLGSGGLSETTADQQDIPILRLPITLGAPQTWTIGGVADDEGDDSLSVATVSGNEPLSLNFAGGSFLFPGDFQPGDPQSFEVGAVTASGSGYLYLQGQASVNRSDDQQTSLSNGAQLLAGGSDNVTGPVVVASGGSIQVGVAPAIASEFGSAEASGTLDVGQSLTLTPHSTLGLTVNAAGTAAGTDYSQLSVSGPVTLGGASLDLEQDADANGSCEDLTPGDVLTLLTTTGTISGTLSNAANGQTVTIQDACNGADTSATAEIDYSQNTVLATILTSGDVADVPQNTSPPTVPNYTVPNYLPVQEGQQLTVSNGTWTGDLSFSYQWYGCNGTCAPIAGATGQSFTPTAQQYHQNLEVEVIGSNAAGSNRIFSGITNQVQGEPVPVLTTAPTESGATIQGDTLTSTTGAWTESPTGYGYQWEDCDRDGQNCTPIPGATAPTYTLTGGDAGHTVLVAVTASNYGGAGGPAQSAPSAVVLPLSPANTAAPQITGTAAVGQTLTATDGTWNNNPTSFTDQWQACDPKGLTCEALGGATAGNYTITAAQAGERIEVIVTALNAGGSTSATSASTALITAAPGAGPKQTVSHPSRAAIEAALVRILKPRGKDATAKALLAHDGYTFSFAVPGAGTLTLSWTIVLKHKTVTVARATLKSSGAGAKRFTLKLTSSGKRALHGKPPLHLASRAVFTLAGEKSVTASSRFTVGAAPSAHTLQQQ